MEIKIQRLDIQSKLYGSQTLPTFKGKLPKNAKVQIAEDTIKIASAAATAAGMVYIGAYKSTKSNFSKEQQDEVLQRYINGETLASIAKNTGCSYSRIIKLIEAQPNIKELRKKKNINKLSNLFTEEQIANIIKRFKDGESYEAIARDYKCNRTTIVKAINIQPNFKEIIEEHNISISFFTTKEKHQIIEMYARGKSASRIAEELGCGVNSVINLINQQPDMEELKEQSKLNRHYSYSQQRKILECYINGEPIMSIVKNFNTVYRNLNYFIKHQPNYEELAAIRKANINKNNK